MQRFESQEDIIYVLLWLQTELLFCVFVFRKFTLISWQDRKWWSISPKETQTKGHQKTHTWRYYLTEQSIVHHPWLIPTTEEEGSYCEETHWSIEEDVWWVCITCKNICWIQSFFFLFLDFKLNVKRGILYTKFLSCCSPLCPFLVQESQGWEISYNTSYYSLIRLRFVDVEDSSPHSSSEITTRACLDTRPALWWDPTPHCSDE